jgi:nucleotidyltransferase/DNA polymerase involved in DNA repair
MVAKMASDFVKPDGLTIVTPESTVGFLRPLPVLKLYGVGPKTAEALGALGIRTIGELADFDVGSLQERLGRKTAVYLHAAASGEDEEPVVERQGATQFSRIITLKKNTKDADEAFNELLPAMEDLHQRLVSKGISFRTLSTMGVLTDLSVKSKSKTFENPVEDLSALKGDVRGLLQGLANSADREFRRVGIRVSELSSKEDQTSLTQFY